MAQATPVPALAATPDNTHVGRQAYGTLDAWRGIASLCVVLYHAHLSLAVLAPGMNFLPGSAWLGAGYLGVPLFFVISGYCIASAALSAGRKAHSAGRFFTARVRRIYPPYAAASLLTVVAVLVASFFVEHGQYAPGDSARPLMNFLTPRALVSTLTITQIPLRTPMLQAVFWTLNYEVVFYALVGALLLPPLRFRPERVLLNVLHGLTLAAIIILLVRPGPRPFPLDFWPQFGLGVLAFDLVRSPRLLLPKLTLALVALGLAVFAATYSYGNRFVFAAPPVRIGFLVSLAFAVLLVKLHPFDVRLEACRPVRALGVLGGFSYSLYLVHPLAIGFVLAFARHARGGHGLALLVIVAEVALSLLAGRLFFVRFERPFLRRVVPRDAVVGP